MEHNKARTSDILNHRSYCVFSRYGTNPFKFEPCRNSCDGLNQVCGNYIPSRNGQQDASTKNAIIQPADNFEILDVLEDGTDPNQYILMMAKVNRTNGRKFLYKDLTDWIRKQNDGGVI